MKYLIVLQKNCTRAGFDLKGTEEHELDLAAETDTGGKSWWRKTLSHHQHLS